MTTPDHLTTTGADSRSPATIRPAAAPTPLPGTSWAPVPLAGYVTGTKTDDPPTVLERTDGAALLYPGRLHAVFGEPEACKGWIALHACAQQLAAGQRVLYVDFEDTPASVTTRLLALSADATAIVERFVYVRPEDPLTKHSQAELLRAAAGVSLAVLDGVTEALALQDLDLASNSDIARWLELLPRPLARAGAAVMTIDHVVKDRESRGRYAIGAQHKLAGVDVAYSIQVVDAFGRGRDGRVKITVTKDRPGHVRGIAEQGRVADVYLTSNVAAGSVQVLISAPTERTEQFRPTGKMERVSKVLEKEPGLSTNAVRNAIGGKHEHVDLALEVLVREQFIRQTKEGQAVRHTSLRPYRESDDLAPSPQPRPNLAPANLPATSPPRPALIGEGRGANSNGTLDLAPKDELLDHAERLQADHPEEL